jgi:hypothetical protein
MKDVSDFVASARDELAAYDQQIDGFRSETVANASRREEIAARLATAYRELTSLLAPTLDAATATNLSSKLSSTEIRHVYDAVETRVGQIRTRLREIEATTDFARRVELTAQLQDEVADATPDQQKLEAEFTRLRGHEGLVGLAGRRYGTPSYPHRGWRKYVRREALNDWKCADAIAEAEGVVDVQEVLLRYEELQRRLAPLKNEIAEDTAHLANIDKLQQEHAKLTAELAAAPDRARTEVGTKAADALLGPSAGAGPVATSISATSISATSVSATSVSAQLVAIDGMRHQIGYLTQLEAQLEAENTDISGRAAKLRDETRRYQSDSHRYRNKRFSDETFAKRFGRADRFGGRLDRYRNAGTTVYQFNSYDRGSYLGDVLWWDVMTDGRMNGSFLPSVDEYRRHNPSYVYHRSSHTGAPLTDTGSDPFVSRDDS